MIFFEKGSFINFKNVASKVIQHLFLDFRYARLVWDTVYVAWGLPRPHNVPNMFVRLLDGLRKDLKPLVVLRAATLC